MTPIENTASALTDSDAAPLLLVGLGDLGARIATEAGVLECPLFGMRRRPQETSELNLITHDASLPWPDLPQPPGDVVLCLPPSERSAAGYQQNYFQVAQQGLAALQQQAPGAHVWLISSTSVYAQQGGVWVDEDSPAQPKRESAQIIRRAEQYWLDSGQPVSVLRPAGLYGPGRTYLLRQAGEGYRIADQEPIYTNRIHVVDAARAVVHLIQRRRSGFAPSSIINLVDRDPVSLQYLMAELQHWLGVEPTTEKTLDRGSKRVSSERLAETGFVWAYPSWREGYQALLQHG